MLTSESCLGVMIIEFELATSTFLVLSDQIKQWQSNLIMILLFLISENRIDLWGRGEGGGLGSVFTGYVLLLS